MLRKFLFILSILNVFLLFSCRNFVSDQFNSEDISFSLGKNAADGIAAAVSSVDGITGESKLDIFCELLNKDSVVSNINESVALKDLEKVKFSFKKIPVLQL